MGTTEIHKGRDEVTENQSSKDGRGTGNDTARVCIPFIIRGFKVFGSHNGFQSFRNGRRRKGEVNESMTGEELMKVCKENEDNGCTCCNAKKECQTWRADLKTLEPWELMKVVNEKEY